MSDASLYLDFLAYKTTIFTVRRKSEEIFLNSSLNRQKVDYVAEVRGRLREMFSTL